MSDWLYRPGVGTFIRVEVPWWGVGAMISGAISLLPEVGPAYCYVRNAFFNTYDGRACFDGSISSNSFDWFFEQTLNEDILWRMRSYRDEKLLPINSHLSREVIDMCRRRVKNLLRVKGEFFERSHAAVGDLSEALGVHYRGTDKYTEVVRVDPIVVATRAREIVVSRGLKRVLLCTDEIEVVQAFMDVLGDTLVHFTDHIRVSGKDGLHQSSGSYLHALEAFTEIISLGLCRSMLIGKSCFADAALLLSSDNILDWEYYN